MEISGNTLLILAAVLFFGLIIPQFFRKLELPFASSLIVLGAVLGPNGLDYVPMDETMSIFGFLGAAFYMMLSGFEADISHLKGLTARHNLLFFLNAAIPFVTGTAIAKLFHYDWPSSLFMGTVFISSSIMIVFSNVRNLGIAHTRLGKTMKSLAVIQDLTGLFLIFLVFKYIEPHQRFPLPILLGLLISSVAILRMFLPEVIGYFFKRFEKSNEGHEAQLRLVIVLLLLSIVFYSALDVNPIVAAFLVGFILSEVPQSENVQKKLDTMGNALFIPIFLFVIGLDMDIMMLYSLTNPDYLLFILLAGAFFSKYISAYLGGQLGGFSKRDNILLGMSSTAKLTVTLSATYAALNLQLIDNRLYTTIVLISLISIILNPVLLSLTFKKWLPQSQ